jgi:hypothetical protein
MFFTSNEHMNAKTVVFDANSIAGKAGWIFNKTFACFYAIWTNMILQVDTTVRLCGDIGLV